MSSASRVTQVPAAPWLVLLLAVAVLITGCSPNAASLPLPPEGPEIGIELIEYEVVYEGPVPPGRVVFRIENAGEHPHQLTLLALDEDAPPIEEQVFDPPEVAPAVVARIPRLRPGETGMFAVGLAEGQRYALMDLSETPDGSLNARLGLFAEFRVGDE